MHPGRVCDGIEDADVPQRLSHRIEPGDTGHQFRAANLWIGYGKLGQLLQAVFLPEFIYGNAMFKDGPVTADSFAPSAQRFVADILSLAAVNQPQPDSPMFEATYMNLAQCPTPPIVIRKAG